MSPAQHPTDGTEIASLVEGWRQEHVRIHEWLARLDGAGTAAPVEVVLRVRADYLQRVDALLGQVAARAGSLRDAASAAGRRAGEAGDRIAELHLRHRIGEIDAPMLALELQRCEDARAAATAERRSALDALTCIDALLDELRPSSSSASPAQLPAAAEPLPDLSAMFAEWEAPPEASTPLRTSFALEDELDFLRVLPASAGEAPHPTPAAAPAPPEPAPPAAAERRTGTGASAAKDRVVSAAGPRTTAPRAILTCRMCRTVNDPRAWYCEGCGAELG